MEADGAMMPMFAGDDAAPAPPAAAGEARPREQALYRRYRSRDFNELVGQDPIVRTLKNALSSGRLAHAYLFSGPRGTGKTSTARLLAKAVNCLSPDADARPCNSCSACKAINESRAVDLIEIDAASNRGVDDVRELRDRVRFAPAELRKKFYIIDEVHMMTTEAFNALLKTLEEPPPHVIFVLATTDPQKLPPTVLSRCQRFDFRRFPLSVMVEHMRGICAGEGYQVEPGVLELIGRQAAGGMRDALTLLDQLMSYSDGVLTLEQAERMLGARGAGEIAALVDTLIDRDMPAGLRLLSNAVDAGADLRHFNRQLVEHLRAVLLLRAGGGTALLEATEEEIATLREQAARVRLPDLVAWIRVFGEVEQNLRNGVHGALPLELALVEAGLVSGQVVEAPAPPAPTPRHPERAAERPAHLAANERAARPAPEREAQRQPPAPASIREPGALGAAGQAPGAGPDDALSRPAALSIETVFAVWPRMVEALNAAGQGRTLAAMFRNMDQGWPHHFEGETLVLGMKFEAHRTRVEEPRYRRQVEDQLASLLGARVLIRAEVMREDTRPRPGRAPLHALPPGSRVRKAAAIFGEIEEQPGPGDDAPGQDMSEGDAEQP